MPAYDKNRPPHGEVTWVEGDERIASTSGPSIQLFIDLYIPRCARDELFIVIRLKDTAGYLPAGDEDYRDDDENLAVTAIIDMPDDGVADKVEAIIPYVVLPQGCGGLMEAEIAVFGDEGDLVALSYYPIELPDDIDRSPDVLTVMTHVLVALMRSEGSLTRHGVRLVRTLLLDNFELDELGDAFLRRILKIANRTHHSPDTLAEVVDLVVPKSAHERFVHLLYAAAKFEHEDEDEITSKQQRFIVLLLEACNIHDHQRFGPAGLRQWYDVLEMEAGASFPAVKKQYKRMVRDYHPDRVHGLAQGFVDYANERMIAFNEAYEELERALDEKPVEATVEIDFD